MRDVHTFRFFIQIKTFSVGKQGFPCFVCFHDVRHRTNSMLNFMNDAFACRHKSSTFFLLILLFWCNFNKWRSKSWRWFFFNWICVDQLWAFRSSWECIPGKIFQKLLKIRIHSLVLKDNCFKINRKLSNELFIKGFLYWTKNSNPIGFYNQSIIHLVIKIKKNATDEVKHFAFTASSHKTVAVCKCKR